MEENEGLLKKLLNSFSRQEGLDDLLSMSEHPNGYKRENAVRRLGMLGNPMAIPKLLARVNDWVPEVRNAARGFAQIIEKRKQLSIYLYTSCAAAPGKL